MVAKWRLPRLAFSGSNHSDMDSHTGAEVRILQGHTNIVDSVAWSPGSKHLASGSSDKTVRLWKIASGECLQTLSGHTQTVYSVTWSPDGQRLASASGDNTIRLWILPTAIVRPCPWQSEPVLKDLQALPKDGKAVITFAPSTGERDQVWTDVAAVIEQRAKEKNTRQ
jgi:WD40 repeat protein